MDLSDIRWKNFHCIEVPEVRFYATYLSTVLNLRVQCKTQNLFGCAIIFHRHYRPPRSVAETQERFCVGATQHHKNCKPQWQMQPIRKHRNMEFLTRRLLLTYFPCVYVIRYCQKVSTCTLFRYCQKVSTCTLFRYCQKVSTCALFRYCQKVSTSTLFYYWEISVEFQWTSLQNLC